MNVTKIESYQIGAGLSASRFYIEIEGHPRRPGWLALEELPSSRPRYGCSGCTRPIRTVWTTARRSRTGGPPYARSPVRRRERRRARGRKSSAAPPAPRGVRGGAQRGVRRGRVRPPARRRWPPGRPPPLRGGGGAQVRRIPRPPPVPPHRNHGNHLPRQTLGFQPGRTRRPGRKAASARNFAATGGGCSARRLRSRQMTARGTDFASNHIRHSNGKNVTGVTTVIRKNLWDRFRPSFLPRRTARPRRLCRPDPGPPSSARFRRPAGSVRGKASPASPGVRESAVRVGEQTPGSPFRHRRVSTDEHDVEGSGTGGRNPRH